MVGARHAGKNMLESELPEQVTAEPWEIAASDPRALGHKSGQVIKRGVTEERRTRAEFNILFLTCPSNNFFILLQVLWGLSARSQLL